MYKYSLVFLSCLSIYARLASCLLLADAEIAADGEGLLLDLLFELDLGLLFDVVRTLLLALDALRARRIHARCFARCAPVFPLAVRAGVAVRTLFFQLAVRATGALLAVSLHLAVRAELARHAVVFLLPV